MVTFIFNFFRNNLKVTHPSQLKFTTDGDLAELGMSKPEMRRLRKYYEKHFPNNYLLKFKKLLTAKKHEPVGHEPEYPPNNETIPTQKQPRVPSKHIIPAANITVNKELGMGEFGVVQQGVWCNEGERIQVYFVLVVVLMALDHSINESIHRIVWNLQDCAYKKILS